MTLNLLSRKALTVMRSYSTFRKTPWFDGDRPIKQCWGDCVIRNCRARRGGMACTFSSLSITAARDGFAVDDSARKMVSRPQGGRMKECWRLAGNVGQVVKQVAPEAWRSRDKRCQSRLETRGQRKALEPGPNAQLAMQIPSDEDDEGKGTKRKRRKKDVRALVVMSCAFGVGN